MPWKGWLNLFIEKLRSFFWGEGCLFPRSPSSRWIDQTHKPYRILSAIHLC